VKHTLTMPVSDYTLEVIAAGISFGSDFQQARA
jgi:hypothetical protein